MLNFGNVCRSAKNFSDIYHINVTKNIGHIWSPNWYIAQACTRHLKVIFTI